jgi:hypothetical protein
MQHSIKSAGANELFDVIGLGRKAVGEVRGPNPRQEAGNNGHS